MEEPDVAREVGDVAVNHHHNHGWEQLVSANGFAGEVENEVEQELDRLLNEVHHVPRDELEHQPVELLQYRYEHWQREFLQQLTGENRLVRSTGESKGSLEIGIFCSCCILSQSFTSFSSWDLTTTR